MPIGRVISLLLALACLALAAATQEEPHALLGVGMCLLGPITLIWWGEELGELTGNVFGLSYVNHTSPGWLVRAFGWLGLLSLTAALVIDAFAQNAQAGM